MYSHTGARVKMLANGDIEIYPAPGREVLIHHEGGAAGPLATKADLDTVIASFNAHVHASAAPGAPTSVPVTIDEVEPPTIPVTYEPPSLAPIGLSTGTTVLKAQ